MQEHPTPLPPVKFGNRRHVESDEERAKREARSCSEDEMLRVPDGKRIVRVVCDWHKNLIGIVTTFELLTRAHRVPYPDHSKPVLAPCQHCLDLWTWCWKIDMQLLRQAHAEVDARMKSKPEGVRGGVLRTVEAWSVLPEVDRRILLPGGTSTS